MSVLAVCLFVGSTYAQGTMKVNGKTVFPFEDCENQVVNSQTPESGWVISDYKTDIHIQKSGTLDIKETVAVEFDDYKHGIYRYIPLVYQPQGEGLVPERFSYLDVSDVSVTLDGAPAQFVKSERGSSLCPRSVLALLKNNELFVKIGDPNATFNGSHTYVISYTVGKALRRDDGTVKLYWNAIPQFWVVPITHGFIRLSSDGIPLGEILCYRGPIGSTDASCSQQKQEDGSVLIDVGQLPAFGGATILTRLNVPIAQVASNIDAPWTWARYLMSDPMVLVSLLPLLVMVYIKRRYGMSPASRGIIAPRFDAPEGMSPAQVGIVADQSVDAIDISSIILSLATKGYLKIRRDEGGILGIGSGYTFIQEPAGAKKQVITTEEQLMFSSIFSSGAPEVSLSDLKYTFAPKIDTIKSTLRAWGVSAGIFRSSPSPMSGPLVVVYIAVFMTIFIGAILGMSLVFWAILVVTVPIIILLIMTFKFYTSRGKNLQEEVQGLKLYMSTAEKDRIEFHNAPEKTPALFERLLPYAMALGVTQIWTDKFKDIFTEAPSWYVGPHGGFIMSNFSRDLTHASSTFASTMTAVKSSSSSFAGGGGGGFSGGGGGGGGGGSW